jgi:hypothetical protein
MPRGLRAVIARIYGTGEHPHYSLFPPINNGQWYVARFALGNTPGQTGGSALFGFGPSLLRP